MPYPDELRAVADGGQPAAVGAAVMVAVLAQEREHGGLHHAAEDGVWAARVLAHMSR